MDGKEAIQRLKRQYKRQNDYNREKYDRLTLTVPKGTRERIEAAKAPGESVSRYAIRAILAQLDRDERAAQDPGRLDTWTDLESPEELPFPAEYLRPED